MTRIVRTGLRRSALNPALGTGRQCPKTAPITDIDVGAVVLALANRNLRPHFGQNLAKVLGGAEMQKLTPYKISTTRVRFARNEAGATLLHSVLSCLLSYSSIEAWISTAWHLPCSSTMRANGRRECLPKALKQSARVKFPGPKVQQGLEIKLREEGALLR
jgi:hypothetical protein